MDKSEKSRKVFDETGRTKTLNVISFKVVIFTCIIIALLFAVAYFIDMNRMKNNKPVIFSNWGYCYVPPIDLPEEELNNAILKFIVDRGDNEKHHKDAKTFASMRVYLIQEEKRDACYIIYAWVLEEKYYLENNEIKQDSGSSIPHKFVLTKEDDEFVVTNVVIPRDGSYYIDDMKSIFPSSVRNDMNRVHTDGTIERLGQNIKEQADIYFHK